jgi:hypothetical protein
MKKSSLAYFRQLCCLGLGGQAVMPSLLEAAHDLIECETNAFFRADDAGRLAGFVPEYFIPEVVDSLLGEFDQLVDRVVPIDFATTMRRGRPVGNLLPMFDDRFYRGPLYNLVYRPYRLHHVLDGVVRDAPGRLGMGAFVVGRSPRQPEFSQSERSTLQRLLPYLAHAMHPQSVASVADFTDSGESGLVILDPSGKIAYSSVRARQILLLAAGGVPSGRDEASALVRSSSNCRTSLALRDRHLA